MQMNDLIIWIHGSVDRANCVDANRGAVCYLI